VSRRLSAKTHSLHTKTSTRSLASVLTVVFVAVLMAALTPSPTLAQTPKRACTHARAKHSTRVCGQSSHKARARHKHRGKHTLGTAPSETGPVLEPASCEDGNAPIQEANGSFSCADGSEPECENGATPTRSPNGTSLLCLVVAEPESESGESECEEGLSALCPTEPLPDSKEGTCAIPSNTSSSFICEEN
jgi:hypothetical protein